VQLQNSLTMNTSADNGNVSFSTTLDALAAGIQGLTITAGTGNVSFIGVVGGTARLGALSVTGGTGTTAYIKPYANMTAGSMIFTGPVQLQATLTLDTSANSGNVSFSTVATTVDALTAGTQGLTITSGTGSVTFIGPVGTNVALASLSVTSTNILSGAITLDSSVKTTGNQSYLGLTTVSGTTGAVVNASSGLMSFSSAVIHTSGTIQAGTDSSDVAIRFSANYTASGTAILAGNSSASGIEFDGNATLESFTQNGDLLVFKGTATQQFDSNNQIIGNVTVSGTDLVIAGHSVNQTGGTYTTTVQTGILDLATNGATLGWVADSAAGTAPTVGLFHGIAGSLVFETGTQFNCVSLQTASGYAIGNAGTNTIMASGNVSIATPSASFSTPANSTLVMTGSGMTLAATPQIGNLTVSGSVTLGAALSMAGNIIISGTLDSSASGNYQITIAGNWTNSGTFTPEAGTVKFTKSSGIIYVNGNNNWYIFDCEVPGIKVYFADLNTQAILAGGKFKIIGSSASPITISRQSPDQTSDLNWVMPTPPSPTYMWQIDVHSGADVDMSYVTVCYSDARAHPIAVPDNVTLFVTTPDGSLAGEIGNTCYEWISGILAIYSYIEDSDGNGKLDRIRVIAQTTLNGDFSGFSATVTGYDIDTSKGTQGFAMVPAGSALPSTPKLYGGAGYEFFIYLKEKNYTDTGTTPTWAIVTNTSLKDSATSKLKLYPITGGGSIMTTAMPTYSCALPRIAYTLALPGKNQVFFHFSGNVYADTSQTVIGASNFTGASSVNRITYSGNGTSEALVTYPSTISAATIASASTSYSLASTLYDAASAPEDYATDPAWLLFWTTMGGLPPEPYNVATASASWPNPIASTTHRVSDVMVSLPPPTSGTYDPASYFAWPIYAKNNITLTLTDSQIAGLTAAQSAAEGIGLIRAFDGSQWLMPQTVTVQARVSANLGSSYQPSLAYDTNVASTYVGSVSGTWLPKHAETSFSGLDALPDSGSASQGKASSAAADLWNLSVQSTDSKIAGVTDNSVFGFFYTLSSSPSDLYVGRLAVSDPATIPADWYRYVRPFSFFFHNVAQQKGGVTILNNVIDPTKGDTVKLEYQLATAGSVTVTVFTLDGDVVARLANSSSQAGGDYVVYWNGKNLGGRPVARGLYFIRLVAPGMDEIRKVLVIRR
jgi:hypothetical protein